MRVGIWCRYNTGGDFGLWRRLSHGYHRVPYSMSMVLGQTLAWRVQRQGGRQ